MAPTVPAVPSAVDAGRHDAGPSRIEHCGLRPEAGRSRTAGPARHRPGRSPPRRVPAAPRAGDGGTGRHHGLEARAAASGAGTTCRAQRAVCFDQDDCRLVLGEPTGFGVDQLEEGGRQRQKCQRVHAGIGRPSLHLDTARIDDLVIRRATSGPIRLRDRVPARMWFCCADLRGGDCQCTTRTRPGARLFAWVMPPDPPSRAGTRRAGRRRRARLAARAVGGSRRRGPWDGRPAGGGRRARRRRRP